MILILAIIPLVQTQGSESEGTNNFLPPQAEEELDKAKNFYKSEKSEGTKLENLNDGSSAKIKFTEKKGKATIYSFGKERSFQDIKPATEKRDAFIKINNNGTIQEMDVTASEKTELHINGYDVPLTKNSRAIYDKKSNKLIIIGDEEVSNDDLPSRNCKFSEEICKKTKGTGIIYKSRPGEKLSIDRTTSPKDQFYLNSGELKYDPKTEDLMVEKGSSAVINDFSIRGTSSNVIFEEDITFNYLDDGINTNGKGFEVSFAGDKSTSLSPDNIPISISDSDNGKFYKQGDTGEDVKRIQKIVGVTPDGEYDEVTARAVKKWQEENNLDGVDGLFGSESLSEVYKQKGVEVDLSKTGGENRDWFEFGDGGNGGETEKEVRQIQRLVGAKTTGEYDGQTIAKVKEFQRKNNLKVDGLFDSSTKSAAQKNKNMKIAMNGGSAQFSNMEEGFSANLEGKTKVKFGNQQYSFDGENINKNILTAMKGESINTPAKITFEGTEKTKTLNLNSRKEGEINRQKWESVAMQLGVDPESISCSAGAQTGCALALESQGGGTIKSDQVVESMGENGLQGNAWQIKSNMLSRGGKDIYNKEKELTPQERSKIDGLKQDLREIAEENGYLDKIKSEKKLNEEERKVLANAARPTLKEIYGENDINSNIGVSKGDMVSIHYTPSSYHGVALLKGKRSQANTHVGSIIGHEEESVEIEEGRDIVDQVNSKIGTKSPYVNSYLYEDSDGNINPAYFSQGNLYKENGELLKPSETEEMRVRRPQLAHLIHYPEDGNSANPFHVENLDQVVSDERMSLYGVTRPRESEYVDDLIAMPDAVKKETKETSCATADCSGFNLEEIYKTNDVPNHKEFAKLVKESTLERKQEYGIPEKQTEDFIAMTSAITERESKFGDSEWLQYAEQPALAIPASEQLQKVATSITPWDFTIDSAGYLQVNHDQAKKYANKFGEEVPTKSELASNKEVSFRYGQRQLADVWQIYVDQNQEDLSKDQIKWVGAAFNSGPYTPRDAAIQKQLMELGYGEKMKKADGAFGPNTASALLNFAKEEGIIEENAPWNYDSEQVIYEKLGHEPKNPEAFEDTEIYQKIKQKYRKKTGRKPKYARVPNSGSFDLRAAGTPEGGTRLTVPNYVKEISSNMQKFRPKKDRQQIAQAQEGN